MTRQWIRVLAGKPGPGSIGFVERTWSKHTLIRFAYDFPFDLVAKNARTFVRLTEAECAVLELTQPVFSVPSGGSRPRQG
jgi:hypothetical protein